MDDSKLNSRNNSLVCRPFVDEKSSDLPVSVHIRACPLPSSQKNVKESFFLDKEKKKVEFTDGSERSYLFDGVLNATCTQQQVYEEVVEPLVKSVTEGFNATVLAYGQTGSGKTYTMGTCATKDLEWEKAGILQRALEQLLSQKENHIQIHLTFLEVYNEKVFDLLAETRCQLSTKPDGSGGLKVDGCAERPIATIEDAMSLVQEATQRRSVAATSHNAHSSRSHALVSIKITKEGKCSFMWVVDLAGSECAGRMNNTTDTPNNAGKTKVFEEGVAINKSLLALGNVLTARAANSGHVPYRVSTLTHLLRESICGNSKTAMIACISLSPLHCVHTQTTLRYAEQARHVRTKPLLHPAPSSVVKLSGMKRRIADPTATPGALAKRFKAPLWPSTVTPLGQGPKGTSGRSAKVENNHNTTVSTPGHTPANKPAPKRPHNNTFASSTDKNSSYPRQRAASPVIFPSLRQPIFEEELGESFGAPARPVVSSSPLQEGPSKSAAPPDVSCLISPLVNRLEQSIFTKMEDRLVDKIFSRLTRSSRASASPKSASSPPSTAASPSCLGTTVMQAMWASPNTRRKGSRRLTAALHDMVTKAVLETTACAKPSRKSQRLARQADSENAASEDSGFRMPQVPPLQKKKAKPDLPAQEFSFLCDEANPVMHLPISSTVRSERRSSRKSCFGLQPKPFNLDSPEGSNKENHGTASTKNFTSRRRSARIACLKDIGNTLTSSDSTNTSTILGSSAILQDTILDFNREERSSEQNVCREPSFILDPSLIAFPSATRIKNVGPQVRRSTAAPVRRSTRLSAIVANERNKTLLRPPTPKSKKNTNKNSEEDTVRLQHLVASPSKVEEHAKQVLDLLNSGTVKQLQKLPLIGPKTAMVIYNHRIFYGEFDSLTDIKNVSALPKSFSTRFFKANLLVM